MAPLVENECISDGGVGAAAIVHMQQQRRPRQEGPATILAVGTVVPPFVHNQSTYAYYYFDKMNCNHKTELKAKFKRICNKTQINKRHVMVRKELLQQYPFLSTFMDARMTDWHKILMEWVLKLAIKAAINTLSEWSEKKASITHIVMSMTSMVNMPGMDLTVAKALGLPLKFRRVMMYHTRCSGGAAILRIAKDITENNTNARVLVILSECTVTLFHTPHEDYLDLLVGQGLFNDGAFTAIVAADPVLFEWPLYEMLWSGEMVVPDIMDAINGYLMEAGMYYHLKPDIPHVMLKSIKEFITDARAKVANAKSNNLFCVVHPIGVAILNQIKSQLKLAPKKLTASKGNLHEYDSMASACLLFVLDQIWRSSKEANVAATGKRKLFGLLIGIGLGLTMDCSVLKALQLA